MTLGKGKHYDNSTSLASSHEINYGDIFIQITYLKKLKNIYLMVIYNSFVAQASWLIYFGSENRIANISNSKWLKIYNTEPKNLNEYPNYCDTVI